MAQELDDAVKVLEAEAKKPSGTAGPNLCVIWKNGGKQIVQAIADALKTSHPFLYRVLTTAIGIIDRLCP